jgi:hypothetical protein
MASNPKYCMDVSDGVGRLARGQAVAGAPVTLWECGSDNKNQVFDFDVKRKQLRWQGGKQDHCVELTGGKTGTGVARLQLAPCDTADVKSSTWNAEPWA